MTWEIRMTRKMKDDVIMVDGKDEFEHLPRVITATATAIVSPRHLSSSAFHYVLVNLF